MNELENLKTASTYARMKGVSTSYIYKLIRDNKLKSIVIDEVIFINIKLYPPI